MVGEEAADVGERRAALLDGGDDGGEVVVEQHEVGGLAGDVGAGAAHRDADVGRVQGRAVVDAVAGHGDDVAPGLQRVGDAQLVLGLDPGDDDAVAVEQGTEQLLVAGRSLPSSTIRSGPSSPTSAAIARAVAGMVAGDHGDPDAGPAARGDGVRRAGTGRVLEPEQAEQLEFVLGVVGCGVGRDRRGRSRSRRPAPASPGVAIASRASVGRVAVR